MEILASTTKTSVKLTGFERGACQLGSHLVATFGSLVYLRCSIGQTQFQNSGVTVEQRRPLQTKHV